MCRHIISVAKFAILMCVHTEKFEFAIFQTQGGELDSLLVFIIA